MENELRALSENQLQKYNDNGFIVVPELLSRDEYREFVDHVEDIRYGRKKVDWYEPMEGEAYLDGLRGALGQDLLDDLILILRVELGGEDSLGGSVQVTLLSLPFARCQP